jgi:hypothetical protein
MKVIGKVVEVFPPERGAVVVAVLVDGMDKPRLLDLRCWGDTLRPHVDKIKPGDRVEADCYVETRPVTTEAGKKYRFTTANALSIGLAKVDPATLQSRNESTDDVAF